MTSPLEAGGAGFEHVPVNLEERAAQLRSVLQESSGALIDSLVAELDVAVDSLTGKELERKLDEIEDDLMNDDGSFEPGSGV